MGCFNTVVFICECCNSEVYVQSKGGTCELKTYHNGRAPLADAGYIIGAKALCKCGKEFEVVAAARLVQLWLKPLEKDDEHSDG